MGCSVGVVGSERGLEREGRRRQTPSQLWVFYFRERLPEQRTDVIQVNNLNI